MMFDHVIGCAWLTVGWLRHRRLAAALEVIAALLMQAAPAYAQLIDCPPQVDLAKQKLPEIVSANGRLRGLVVLSDTQESFQIGTGKCVPQLLRFFQNHEPTPPDPNKAMAPLPGPTLRAKLGDIVELTFLNQIDPLDYGNSIDRWENLKGDPSQPGAGCNSSTAGYPQLTAGPPPLIDSMPDCFHGSSTGNMHFHGTHVSPTSTGDNVFVMVRPSPRKDGQPTVNEASVQHDFDTFFAECEKALRKDNLAQWPKVWADLPSDYTAGQEAMLKAYDQGRPPEMQLWPVNAAQIAAGEWPQYYIGALPYCYVLPKYPGVVPAYPGMAMQMHMGQAPGTHWYHAHKHGSTALNVSNGMAGAFIIEGDELRRQAERLLQSIPDRQVDGMDPPTADRGGQSAWHHARSRARRSFRPAAVFGQWPATTATDDVPGRGAALADRQRVLDQRLLPGQPAGGLHLAADRAGRRAVRRPELPGTRAASGVRGTGQPHRPAGPGADHAVERSVPGECRAGRVRQSGTDQHNKRCPVFRRAVRLRTGHAADAACTKASGLPERHHIRGGRRPHPHRRVRVDRQGRTTPAHDRWREVPGGQATGNQAAEYRRGMDGAESDRQAAGRSSVPYPREPVPDHRGVRSERSAAGQSRNSRQGQRRKSGAALCGQHHAAAAQDRTMLGESE